MPWVHDQFVTYFQRQADELDYRFADLTEALRLTAGRLGAEQLLYEPNDLHFTRAGHEAAANAILHREPGLFTRHPGSPGQVGPSN
jgi:hypothetical protein